MKADLRFHSKHLPLQDLVGWFAGGGGAPPLH
jgi:hypothetical protein